MSDWAWVALGYGVVYGVLAVYAGFLVRRVLLARRVHSGDAPRSPVAGVE